MEFSLIKSQISGQPVLNLKELVTSSNFPELIFFHPQNQSIELCTKGVAQIGFEIFRSIYEHIQELFELPLLTEQPQLALYADGTFSINWWGEVLFCQGTNQFFDHLNILNDKYKAKSHQSFKADAQKIKNFFAKVEAIKS